MEEKWKDINGYEGLYQVSSLGRVKSLKKNVFMTPQPKGTHLRVCLVKDGVVKSFYVHRLVAIAFIENKENKEEVHHKNLRGDDNRVENLEWVTKNEHQAYHYGSFNSTSSLGILRKKIFQFSLDGELIGIYDSIKTASNFLNCAPSTIVDNLKGKSKVAHNSLWKYAP